MSNKIAKEMNIAKEILYTLENEHRFNHSQRISQKIHDGIDNKNHLKVAVEKFSKSPYNFVSKTRSHRIWFQ